MNDTAAVEGKRLMILGVALLVLGAIALFAPVFAGSAVVITIGIVLLVAPAPDSSFRACGPNPGTTKLCH